MLSRRHARSHDEVPFSGVRATLAPHATGKLVIPSQTFEEVYEKYFDFVWRSLRLLGVPLDAVEDATQDTFSVVSRRLVLFEGRSSMRTWLFAILQRIAANYRRAARRKLQKLEPLTDELLSLEPTAHAQVEFIQAIDTIQRYCDTLDFEWRALFVLGLLEEVPSPEVAKQLQLPLNTVYSRMRSLRRGLRCAFELDQAGPAGRDDSPQELRQVGRRLPGS